MVDAHKFSYKIIENSVGMVDRILILGQANLFFEFDVCFFRARSEFEVCQEKVR